MKVAYLTVGELVTAPLLRRQVIELLEAMCGRQRGLALTLVSLLSPHTWFLNRRGLSDIAAELADHGVRLLVIPTPVPWPLPLPRVRRTADGWRPYVKWTPWAVRFAVLVAFPVLLFLYLWRGVRLFHCRSYPAAYCAFIFSKVLPKTRIIFDPRSDFPEENVTAGNWPAHGRAFRFWKRFEARMLRSAAATICIAETYEAAYRPVAPEGKYVVCPNNVDVMRFSRRRDIRTEVRDRLGIRAGEVILCYLGDLSDADWHRPGFYARAVERFRGLDADHRFLFVIPRRAAPCLHAAMRDRGISAQEYIVVHPAYEEVPDYLAASDYGVMFLHRRKIAVGTKISEYAACGLPALVNQNCLGAVELIGKYGVGSVVPLGLGDLDDTVQPDRGMSLPTGADLDAWSATVRRAAERNLSNDRVADTYLAIYRDVATGA